MPDTEMDDLVGGAGVGHNSTGGVAAQQLRASIERIERLNEEKKVIADDIKEVFAEAKSAGFDTPTMRKIIALRKMDEDSRIEAENMLELYKNVLGL